MPPKLTAVTHLKLVPLMVRVSKRLALAGVNSSMVGCTMGINENPLRDDDPTGDVILISPVVPESTIA